MKTPGHFPSDPHAPTELSHDAPKDSLLGAQLGNYVIEGQLGRGGFGAVYKARDVKLDRSVALKFLLDTVQPDHLALFEREAKAIAALSKHGSIVQIHSWGEYDGKVYMALEFIDSSGEHLIRTYPEGLDAVKALRLIHSAAQGLAYAHGQGIYHRDIKPANILVDSQSGTAKLADFGLAKFAESLQGSILQGRISGSPPFMSPEQATGGLYDERSDIFSLGATLYNLLTGKLPYEGKTPSRVIEKVVKNQRVGLAERRSDLPESVVAIVDKAMAFTPADRYDSVEEMIADIESALAELDAKPAPVAESAPRKPMPVALIGVGVGVGVAVILVVLAVAFMMGGGKAADGPTAGVATAQAPAPVAHLGGGSAPSETGASANAGDTVQVTSKVAESASIPAPPAAEGKTPESIIHYYLESWRDGDYAAMYGALAASVRQGMTFAEFEDALINDVRGPVARIESVDPEGDAEPREPAPNPFRTTADEGAADSNPFAEGQQEESRAAAEPVARESAPWWYVDVAFSNGATGPQRLRTGVLKEGGGWRIGAGGLVPVDGGASLFRRPQL